MHDKIIDLMLIRCPRLRQIWDLSKGSSLFAGRGPKYSTPRRDKEPSWASIIQSYCPGGTKTTIYLPKTGSKAFLLIGKLQPDSI